MNALILAAGRASRLGLPKALLPAGPGRVLLSGVLEAALDRVEGRVGVVTGRAHAALGYVVEAEARSADAARVRLLYNPDYAQGLSTSLQRGVEGLGETEPMLVLLADQPLLEASRVRALVEAYPAPGVWAVSATENSQPKPPVVLGPELLRRVGSLEGDQGAKPLLVRYAERVRGLEWGSGPWFTDVDTWETYRALARLQGWDKERFEPLSALSSKEDLEVHLDTIPEPRTYLEALRRGVLTLLSRGS
ncbi:MAG: nucleotidyltransferase family protein [Thermaceae bacterium]|nr:nucleotidyltransferase family protein [Thermaceae bacterium]